MTLLITGITGFIGRNLALALGSAGRQVYGTTTRTPNEKHFLCDLRQRDSIFDVIRRVRPDAVVHLAALPSVTAGHTMQYYESNVLATENLFAAINEMGIRCRVLFVSTAGVYGNQATNVLSEDLRPLPVSHYGLSKFVCERLASILGGAHDVTIARPFNVIGPGQNADFLVPKLVHHFAHREPRILLGNLDPVRDYIDVAACCDALVGLLTKDEAIGETVNICSGQGSSVREMLSHLRELSGHDIEAVVSPEFVRKNEVWSLLGCARKLDSLLPNRYRGASLRTILSSMLDEAVGAPNHNR